MKDFRTDKLPTSPIGWLDHLNRAMKASKGKINQQPASLEDTLDQAGRLFKTAIKDQTSIWWVGNGGSAAICSHLAQDVMNKLGVKSVFLGEASLLTCMANDFGYEQVYARPLKRMAEKNDVLIAISSSGNSENIISSVKLARDIEMKVITLSGMDETNMLWSLESDVSIYLDSNLYGIVEVGHEAILHGIVETLWLKLFSRQ